MHINSNQSAARGSAPWNAGRLAEPMPPFSVSMTCAEAFEWFQSHVTQPAAAIVDDKQNVVGIVNRLRFLARYAQKYVPELYGKRAIIRLANTKPLLVETDVPVSELASMITMDWPDALRECFVVVSAGRYFGIGTSEALVRSKVEMLGARETDLQDALLRATDASRTKSNFLALMSHELRTPLNAIIGFSELIAQQLYGAVGDDRYRDYAADINHAGKHLLALINDILDLSKAEAGKLDLSQESVNLSALFQDCLRFVAARARDQGVSITVSVPPNMPALIADSLRMRQVVLNLLSNAIKFTPPGGSIELLAAADSTGGLILSVRDTGIGMKPEMIPIALEPFRQIASPLSRNVEGTGLGLTLVKSLTEQQGGSIHIESAPDQGTKVTLHFPCARAGSPGAEIAA